MKHDPKGTFDSGFLKTLIENAESSHFILEDGENNFRELANHAPVLLWMSSPDGDVHFINQTWLSFTGRSVDEELGLGWTVSIHPDDFQKRSTVCNTAFEAKKSFSVEYRLRRFDGEYRWILDRGKPLYASSGVVTGYIGSCIDITEIKAAQAILDRNETLLKFLDSLTTTMSSSLRAEDLYQKFANQAVLSFCDWCYIDLIDANTNSLVRSIIATPPGFNEQLSESFIKKSYELNNSAPSASAFRDSKMLLLSRVEPHMLQSWREKNADFDKFVEMIQPQSLICAPIHGEHKAIGVATFVISSQRRVFDANDVVLCEEITHRLTLALENARLYDAVKTSSFLKDEFLATLSHELRTPMTSIVGWSNLLRKGNMDSNTFQVAVSSIEKNALAQASLIDDLLDVSSIVAGQLTLNLEVLNLTKILESVIQSARHVVESKNVKIHLEAAQNTLITGDEIRLQQVFWNVLFNAIKYTNSGGEIWIDLAQKNSRVVLTIRDNGDGVEKDFLPQMFENFRQQDSGYNRAHGGLGLGLSISKQLVEMHQGTITAKSPGVGQGTTIQIDLPAKIEKVIMKAKATSSVPVKTDGEKLADNSLKGQRILLIDDAPDIRMIVSYILQREGAATMEAESVDGALDKLRQNAADLILCDIGMPHRDGFDFLKSFKDEFKQLGHISVIALTAFARDEEKTKILAAGFDEHIAKPVNPQLLVKILKERLLGK